MNIAYITSAYGRAADTFIRNEVLELRRAGNTVHTFSIRKPARAEIVDEEIAREQAGTFYLVDGSRRLGALIASVAKESLRSPVRMMRASALALKTGSTGIKARLRQLAYVFEASLLAGQLRKKKVQHLHDHIGENSGTVAMLASLLTGVPFSMTIHGPGTFYAAEKFALGEKIHRSAFTVCISDFCRSQCMVFSDSIDWGRLHIVRCGVENEFLRETSATIPEAPRLVCVGRLCAEKGQLLLIKAVKMLRLSGIDLEMVFIGDGPMRGELEKSVDTLGLRENIVFRGWQTSSAIRQELRDSRGLVLASFAEGLPVVVMESLALGRPVIATQIAGIPELVKHGENGWLVPAGNIEALARAIREMLASPVERLREMGQAGARRVREFHDVQKEAGTLAELFRRHAQRNPAHTAAISSTQINEPVGVQL